MIPAARWEPDKGPFNVGTTDYVMNVQPISNGWAPLPSPSQVSADIGEECRGGCYYRSSTGAFGIILGTPTKLLKVDATVAPPYPVVDVSSGAYNVPDGHMWQFERHGTKLFATQLGDDLQQLDVDIGGAFSATPGSPPRAKFLKTIGDFLVLAYIKVGATEKPQSWATSGLADTDVWTAGVELADDQDIRDGDEITGILGNENGGRIIQRHAKRSLLLTADAAMPIRSQTIDPEFGCFAPYSIVMIGASDYVYLDEDGFKRGDERIPIGTERVNNYFFANCALDGLELVQGCADPFKHIVWWTYLGVDGLMHLIGWDWELDQWCQSNVEAAVMLPIVTSGNTLEQLTAIFASLYGVGSIDAPGAESLDSRRWKGGRPLAGMMGTDNILYSLTGENLAAQFDTTSQVLSGDNLRRKGINMGLFVGDTKDYQMAVGFADSHGDAILFKPARTASQRNGLVTAKGEGKLVRARIYLDAGVDWSFGHGVELYGPNGGMQ